MIIIAIILTKAEKGRGEKESEKRRCIEILIELGVHLATFFDCVNEIYLRQIYKHGESNEVIIYSNHCHTIGILIRKCLRMTANERHPHASEMLNCHMK